MENQPPISFGAYQLLSRIGLGGMGEIWLARRADAAPGAAPVVVKRILPHHADDPNFIESFVNEAHVTASLTHPNVAQVLDFGNVDGEYFFAIEHVHGRTVEDLLAAAAARGLKQLPVPVACHIAAAVLDGLDYAHGRVGPDGRPLKIVHRDVSPDNVLVGFDGAVKLVDFGVAKARLRGRSETQSGLVKGKWHYFSPEQARAEPLDGRSDIFAVGVMLYRLLCGRLPFEGPHLVAVHKALKADYAPPQVYNPSLPPSAIDAIHRALEVNREKRFATAGHMARGMRNLVEMGAPGYSARSMRAFVHWAFDDQLAGENIEPDLDAREQERIERWLSDARDFAAQGSSQGEGQTRALPRATQLTTAQQRPRARRFPLPAAAAAALFLLGGVGTTLFALRKPAPATIAQSPVRPPEPQVPRPPPALPAPPSSPSPEPKRAARPEVPLPPTADVLELRGHKSTVISLSTERHFLEPPPLGNETTPWTVEVEGGQKVQFEAGPASAVTVATLNQTFGGRRQNGYRPVRILIQTYGAGPFIRDARRISVFHFRPFESRSDHLGSGLAKFVMGHNTPERVVRVPTYTWEDGHFLLLRGLSGAFTVSFRNKGRQPEDRFTVLAECLTQVPGRQQIFENTYYQEPVVTAPKSCALALVGERPAAKTIEVEVTFGRSRVPPAALPKPGTRDWAPTFPGPLKGEVTPAGEGQVAQLLTEALELIDAEAFDKASSRLKLCLEILPRSADCHRVRGFSELRRGNEQGAVWHYRQFIELAPNHPEAARLRSTMLKRYPFEITFIPR